MSTRSPSTTNSSAVRIVLDGYAQLKRVKSRVTTSIGSDVAPSVTPWSKGESDESTDGERRDATASTATEVRRDPDEIDLSQLEPSTRIMTTIEREGGWMWQSEVVESVDLSSSTVSRHLSSLEDDDEVQRVRIGREKVIGLPDADLEVFQSPYESDR